MIIHIDSYVDFLMGMVVGILFLSLVLLILLFTEDSAINAEPPQIGGPPRIPRG